MSGQAVPVFSFLQTLRRDYFFWVLLGLLVLLTALKPGQIFIYPSLVDWSTLAALAGLLVLTKGVELSGFLHHLGKHLIALMPTERAVAMLLVFIAAFLSPRYCRLCSPTMSRCCPADRGPAQGKHATCNTPYHI